MRGQSKVQFFGRAGLDVGVQIEEVRGGLKIDFSVVRVHLVLLSVLIVDLLSLLSQGRTEREGKEGGERGSMFGNLMGAWEVLMD